MRFGRRVAVGLAAAALTAAVVACVPEAPPPTRIAITTTLTVCGGAVPPPGEPFCRTSPTSGAVTVRLGRTTVASGTTVTGVPLVLDVPAGTLVVSRTDAETYLICDTPSVAVASGTTAGVVQNCTLNAP